MQPTPLLPVNNQTPEQAFLTENYDENALTTTRRYLPHSQTHLQRQLRASLGSSSCSLRQQHARETRRRTNIDAAHTWAPAKYDAAWSVPELLKVVVES